MNSFEQDMMNGAFRRRKDLKMIEIPEGVKKIPPKAFDQCAALCKIILPDSLEAIEDMAFTGCMALNRIDIPKNVEKIDPHAFTYCLGLKEINVSSDNEYYSSVDGVLYDKDETVLIKYPAALTGEAVISEDIFEIGEWAFEWSAVNSIIVPDGVEKIGARAFSGCFRAQKITLPDSVIRIGQAAFYSCKSIEELIIPDGVMIIEKVAFHNCSNLKKLVIPESVGGLDTWTFDGCLQLTVYCPQDSLVWEYCETIGIPHQPL